MDDYYMKASAAHSALNRRGWAFTWFDNLSAATTYVALDSFSRRVTGHSVAVIFDWGDLTAEVYIFKANVYTLKKVPEPSRAKASITVPLRAGVGGIAWANDVEKALAMLSPRAAFA